MEPISRRTLAAAGLAALFAGPAVAAGLAPGAGQFGQVNKLTAKPGKIAALHAELSALTAALVARFPGALTYELLSHDGAPDTLWTLELWPSAAAHAEAVATPDVQASIARCRPMIARFENLATFTTQAPVAGRPAKAG